jgi:hypothetical protein
MRRLVHSALSLIGLAVLAYVYFFVPIGRRTLHEHALRIADTEPARELRGEAADATRRFASKLEEEWAARYGRHAAP